MNCNDCDCDIKKGYGVIKLQSARFGVYYDNPLKPICVTCANVRYEMAVLKFERSLGLERTTH